MEKKIKELQEKFNDMDVLLNNILKRSKETLRILQESNAKAAIREAEHKARMMEYTTNSTLSEEDYLLNKPVKPKDIIPVKKKWYDKTWVKVLYYLSVGIAIYTATLIATVIIINLIWGVI